MQKLENERSQQATRGVAGAGFLARFGFIALLWLLGAAREGAGRRERTSSLTAPLLYFPRLRSGVVPFVELEGDSSALGSCPPAFRVPTGASWCLLTVGTREGKRCGQQGHERLHSLQRYPIDVEVGIDHVGELVLLQRLTDVAASVLKVGGVLA